MFPNLWGVTRRGRAYYFKARTYKDECKYLHEYEALAKSASLVLKYQFGMTVSNQSKYQ
jgi:hypothetical protein